MSLLQSRHTSPTTSKYRVVNGASSSSWSGSAKPVSVARNVAFGSVPLMMACQAASLAAASGIAARQVAARRSPASVASRRSSASISAGPAAPWLHSRCSSRQRSSVSTTRPSMNAVPSSRPLSRARSLREVARLAKAWRKASCRSEPGAARSARPSSTPVASLAPPARQAGSVNRRSAAVAWRSRVCTTEMSSAWSTPAVTSWT